MMAALLLVLLIVLLSLTFIVLFGSLRWFGGGPAPRLLRPLVSRAEDLRLRLRRGRDREPLPTVLITMDLRRLQAEVRRVEEGDEPYRAMRLRAAVAAYDSLLLELCEREGVEARAGLPPLPSAERLTLEAELMAAGHDW